jgi:hypothetical protein
MKITTKITLKISLTFILVIGILNESIAQANDDIKKSNKRSLSKSNSFTPQDYALLNINNLTTWQRKDGYSNHSPAGKDGVSFPRGTVTCIYQDGILWGAKVYVDSDMTIPAPFAQTIRVGGANYGSSCQSGWIEGFGANAVPIDSTDTRVRIYRIRRGWQEMNDEEIRQDVAECFEIPISEVTEGQTNIILDDYKWCWENWPVDLGAPFIDRNNNGIYDLPPPFRTDVPKNDPSYFGPHDLISEGYDEPGIGGSRHRSPAGQVIWAVWNDLNRSMRFGSEPIGLEIQTTLWGYKRKDALNNIIFRKLKIINKGGTSIDNQKNKGSFFLDSMYVGQWVDSDLGDAGDDLSGCDTVLNMGYFYNGNYVDNKYNVFDLPPPSIGYQILQGPIISSPNSRAIFNFKNIQNYKNLGLTAFWYKGTGTPFGDPSNNTYDYGAIHWYQILRGFVPLHGIDIYFPHPPGITVGPFPMAGDPVAKTGHIDGLGEEYSYMPGDRRFLCSSGPFQMVPGDTQEVIIAIVCGLGTDRLSSISVMKYNARWAQIIAAQNFDIRLEEQVKSIEQPIPQNYHLSQNYPNPFRTSTNIRYELPSQRFVNLSIYNLLGQKVKTLVEEIQNPSSYSYQWDGKDSFGQRVSNGVYFFKLEAGAVILTKKLMVLE